MINLSKPYITDEAIEDVVEVLKSGRLVQGKYVEQFEKDLSNYTSAKYSVVVSSGTAALHLALLALGVGEGDVVFVPAFTFPATVNVVELQKARPILVDVEMGTYNMDPNELEKAIINFRGNEKPRAIIVVHEFGAPANMTAIMKIARKYNLLVIEDAACALGTKWNGQHVGTFGDIGCFSFHPRKAITTGEGGAVVVKDKTIYDQLLLLRNHGLYRSQSGNIDFIIPGLNYRLTDFQAVLGIHQLKDFERILKIRKKHSDQYFENLNGCKLFTLPDKVEGHNWQTYMIVSNKLNRDKLIKELYIQGIETNLGAQAIPCLAFYNKKYTFNEDLYPNSINLFKNGLALPLHPFLTCNEIIKVSELLWESNKEGEG